MHEMGIALQVLKVAMAAIPAEMAGTKVQALHLKVGKLTAVVPQSLRFCFEVASQDTPLAGARLVIEEVPIEAECRACGARMLIERARFVCTQCNGGQLDIISGRDLLVTSLELADRYADPPASGGKRP